MIVEIAIVLILVLINGVLSGTEIAVVSIRKTRLNELVDERGRRARALARVREDPERFFATVQIGITVVGATAAAFGGSTFAQQLEPALRNLPGVGVYSRQLAMAIVVAGISYLSLVLGELVPKSLALRHAESYALWVARPLLTLSSITRPLVWLLTASSNVILRPFGDRTQFSETKISTDELQQVMVEATRSGSVHPAAGEIAARALEFGRLSAAHAMVPREHVISLRKGADMDDLRRMLLEHGHTRVPLYERDRDEVIGYINVKDVIALLLEKELFILDDLIRPALFVPESKPAVDLLEEMRKQRVPLAIVIDEVGAMAGLVTMEDLLEELVGEIFSEQADVREDVVKEADGSYRVSGTMPLRDLNRTLDLALPEGDGYSTLGGLCMVLAERIPAAGEHLESPDGTHLEVLEASERHVNLVRVQPPREPSTPPDENA
ncbi:MAG TPA: hemolysin family protein [Polyangiaceae bacterium]|nr:hemolysin family protein [Polyangiaceae bacterium]